MSELVARNGLLIMLEHTPPGMRAKNAEMIRGMTRDRNEQQGDQQ